MQHKQLNAFVPKGKNIHVSELFGYSNKGIPGLEIVGLGSKGRAIKEKFYFINKKLGLKMPNRRFVLCVEDPIYLSSKDELHRWLELPLLIMYWSLAGVIPIQNLDDCLCGGLISSKVDVKVTPVEHLDLNILDDLIERDYKVITSRNYREYLGTNVIPIEEVFVDTVFKEVS